MCTRNWMLALALATAALWSAGAAEAQEGTVAGRAVDSGTGLALQNAEVELVETGGTDSRVVLTDPDGRFRTALPEGTYTVEVRMLGRQSERREGVRVALDRTTELDFQLLPRAIMLEEVYTVSRRPEVGLVTPQAASIIHHEEIRDLTAPMLVDRAATLPGVDLTRTGLTQRNVVVRGFNNVFSGALLTLVDHRYARVPSLRLNAFNMIPTTDLDVERMEVVRGPGAALYGPNAAQGVLHLITSSPLDRPGTVASLATGIRSGNDAGGSGEVLHGLFRTAHRLDERVGLRVSGQYFAGDDWAYVDPVETARREDLKAEDPDDPLLGYVGNRSPRAERMSADARVDFRPWEDGEIVLSGGVNELGRSVELTPVGAAQARDWQYRYVQGRVRRGRLFGQVMFNTSDSGNDPGIAGTAGGVEQTPKGTYLLRSGQPIVDRSRFLAAQLQHGFGLDDRLEVQYGIDFQRTDPRTGGTITGANEDDDESREVGGYLHGDVELTDRLRFVGAARLDGHSRLDGPVFSPRAAVVFQAAETQSVRLTFNRAFGTPTTNNLHLDLPSGRIPLFGGVGYDVRAVGVPGGGYTFDDRCEGGAADFCMRSPFQEGRLRADAAPFWNPLLETLAAGDPDLAPLVPVLRDPEPGDLASLFRRLDAEAGAFPVDASGPASIPGLEPTIWNTVEAGYKGFLAGRLSLELDVYRSEVQNFIGPLRVETPSVFFDPTSVFAYSRGRLQPLVDGGMMTADDADAAAQGLAEGFGQIPVGTVAPDQRTTPDLLLTFRNYGEVSLWGADAGVQLLVSDRLTLGGSYSWVSDNCFDFDEDGACTGGRDVVLNAPRNKGSLFARYDADRSGWTLEGRARLIQRFPMNSGIFVGEVGGYTVVDASSAYRLPFMTGASLSVSVTNLFDERHREFLGAPQLGRLALLRMTYEL